jgi:Ca2+-binding RTX toxin-like protein
MASFTVNTGVTDTTAKTVSNNDTGTIQSGGTLSAATAITWTGGSTSPGVTINNSGTINATTRAIDTSGSFATGSLTLNNSAGAKLLSLNNDAFRVNTNITSGTITVVNSGLLVSGAVDASNHIVAHASGQALDFAAIVSPNAVIQITNNAGATIGASGDDAIRPGAGHVTITNSGLIDATASNSRAINLNTGNLSNVSSFQLTNNDGGTIQSTGDAVRITATTLSTTATGTFAIDNAGTIQSTGTGANNGQAIDFNDLVSPLGHVTITNQATGVIQAADADAIRPGVNATINNYGKIISNNGTPTSTGNDGIDFQSNTGGTVNNFTGGSITGARHGITGDQTITVNNAGTITGQVGAGINMDTAGTTTTTVNNSGTIVGTSVEGVQSGDAVDVDGLILLNNHGSIQALGTRSDGLSEGVTVGGGTVNNYADGTITSSQRAITFDGGENPDGSPANAFTSATVYNEGKIRGDNGEAIVIVDTFADMITNKGAIIGSISTGDGDDVVNIYVGSSISGLTDGGAASDTINLLGSGSGTLSDVTNFEVLDVQGGSWTIVSDESFAGGTTIASGAELTLGNGGAAGSVGGDVSDHGLFDFDRSDSFTFGGAISGSGAVQQLGAGTTTLAGHNSYAGGTELVSGTLDVATTDAAGTGAITFEAGSQTLRIEQTALAAGHFANTLVGFVTGDTIDLAGIGLATSATLGAGNLLTISGGSSGPITLQLDPAHDYTGQVFRPASDNGGGTNITVAVDQAPVFTSSASFSIQENGTAVGTVTASDPENDGFVFALAGGDDQAFFSIDAHTGALSFLVSPDFESPEDANHDGVYNLVVSARDSFSAVSTQTISVSVTDVVEVGRTINGGNGNDTLAGTTGDDVINGSNGDDRLDGGDGDDNISGGNGNDVLIGGRGNDFLDGGNGNDILHAGVGNNVLDGGNGDDVLDAGDGNDSLAGGNGDDILHAGGGNNVLDGGNGNDALDAGDGNDSLTGGAGNDTLHAGGGNNLLDGGNGDDVLEAGDGDDTLIGGAGNDTLHAGGGTNVLDGGNGDDNLDAGDGNDTLTGGSGNDVLHAGNGNNKLDGGNGDDKLYAGSGNDTITAGNGNDILSGGGGNDILTGGNGNDTFVFAAGFGKDVITDFGHGDHIEFDGGVFQDFQAVQAASHQDGANTVISLDADHAITLQNVTVTNLHASDFILI